MSITNGYATVAQFSARYLPGQTVGAASALETQIEQTIQAASRQIDVYCGRHFWKTSSGTARVFTPDWKCKCFVDDLISIDASGLKTDDNQDGTYETTWATTDYWLQPQNLANGEPYTWIEVKPWGNNSFLPGVTYSVQITGTWGWTAVPDVVREACLLQSFRIYKRQGAPFGVTGAAEFGVITTIPKLDPDVEELLTVVTRVI